MRNKKCRRIIEILFILLLIVPSQPIYAKQEEAVEEVEREVVALSHQVKWWWKRWGQCLDFKFIMKHKLLFGSVAFFLLSGGVVLMFVEIIGIGKWLSVKVIS